MSVFIEQRMTETEIQLFIERAHAGEQSEADRWMRRQTDRQTDMKHSFTETAAEKE